MSKRRCFRCGGTGEISHDVISLVIIHLIATQDCPACDGNGWIYDYRTT